MKLRNLTVFLSLPVAFALVHSSAGAAVVFTDDFEDPDVTAAQSDGNTNGQITTSDWVRATAGFGATRQGTVDEAHGDFTDPVGSQAYAFRYTNSGITTTLGTIGNLAVDTTYTVTFDIVEDGHNAGLPYTVGFVTFDGAGTRNAMNAAGFSNGVETVLGQQGGSATGTTYQQVTFSYTYDAADAAFLGQDVALRFEGATNSAIIDNVSVEVMTIPEPSSLSLLALLGACLLRRRR